jgi:hypothetical protein
MSTEPLTPDASEQTGHLSTKRQNQLLAALPWLWISLSVFWAGIILVTDQMAWPIALWIATTVGPLTMLRSRLESKS